MRRAPATYLFFFLLSYEVRNIMDNMPNSAAIEASWSCCSSAGYRLSRCRSPTLSTNRPKAADRGRSLLSLCLLYAKRDMPSSAMAMPALARL